MGDSDNNDTTGEQDQLQMLQNFAQITQYQQVINFTFNLNLDQIKILHQLIFGESAGNKNINNIRGALNQEWKKMNQNSVQQNNPQTLLTNALPSLPTDILLPQLNGNLPPPSVDVFKYRTATNINVEALLNILDNAKFFSFQKDNESGNVLRNGLAAQNLQSLLLSKRTQILIWLHQNQHVSQWQQKLPSNFSDIILTLISRTDIKLEDVAGLKSLSIYGEAISNVNALDSQVYHALLSKVETMGNLDGRTALTSCTSDDNGEGNLYNLYRYLNAQLHPLTNGEWVQMVQELLNSRIRIDDGKAEIWLNELKNRINKCNQRRNETLLQVLPLSVTGLAYHIFWVSLNAGNIGTFTKSLVTQMNIELRSMNETTFVDLNAAVRRLDVAYKSHLNMNSTDYKPSEEKKTAKAAKVAAAKEATAARDALKKIAEQFDLQKQGKVDDTNHLCKNCYEFGHQSANCKQTRPFPLCSLCGSKEHRYRECDVQPQDVNKQDPERYIPNWAIFVKRAIQYKEKVGSKQKN
mmetsp:Transcript_9645/g.11678  ORF Transcript_9645/g.11678 Transcript_9645/m.11678 type:complete len:523 (+) Transcript_9645:237-1805(+)